MYVLMRVNLQSSNEFTSIYIFESSAKRENLQNCIILFKSLINNNRNNKDDRCPPCGTSETTQNGDDIWSNILTF